MSYAPCLNPNCKSHGQPHPNCRCGEAMAEGGEVSPFCSSARPHSAGCEYYADGGQVDQIDFTPNSSPAPMASQGEATPALDFVPDDQSAAKEAKYGSAGQIALTALEGAGKGLAGPLATLAETKLGVKGEDITNRAETNPVTHGLGEAAGLIAPAALTDGASLSQSGFLGTAGAHAAEALGFQGAKGTAIKLGVENALYSLGDEISKKIAGNPDSIQTAAAHVGLSGLIGGGVGLPLGAVSELWTKRIAPKAEPFVQDFIGALKGETPEAAFTPSTDQPIKNFYRPGAPLFPEKAVPTTPGSKAGAKAAEWLNSLAAETIGDSLGGGIGHKLGKITGIPGMGMLGGYIGHNAIVPIVKQYLPTIAKTLLESDATAAGLKSAFDAIEAITAGDSLINKTAKGLFEAGSNGLMDVADHDRLLDLDHQVSALGKDPSGLLNVGGQIGHYMPGHQTALAATAQNAVNYLNEQRPMPTKPGVLNAIIEPSPAETAAYFRTLGIAEQPLGILNYIKEGTLHPKDMQDLNVLYPGLIPNITQKVNNHLIDHMSKGKSVPFKMRWGLSMLMGTDLDTLFSAQSIQAAQATHMVQQPQPTPQGAPKPKGGTAKLGESAKLAQTPAESRQKALSKA